MRIILLLAMIIVGFSGPTNAQENFNMDLVSNVTFGNERGNDIWGYVDENGIEYAVMGTADHTRIFSLEDPANPIERAAFEGDNTTWRDHKSWGNFIYSTNDQGGTDDGLMIIDMTNAPEDITHIFWTPQIEDNGQMPFLETCHNLYIDENGVCYLAGCNIGVGGVLILDIITNPMEPIILGIIDDFYSHDVYTVGDVLYSSQISNGTLGIYDVSDKANPILLSRTQTTTTFTHNAWASDDGNYVFTTDERPDAFVDSYDVSDPTDVKRLDSYQPAETVGRGVIPHNTHYYDGFLITSWYTDGVVIVDASRPSNLVKVGAYDTFLGNDGGFSGCWGAYPYLPSGLILASDINSGLYVFQPNYVRACWLEGSITDAENNNIIMGATIRLGTEVASSNIEGMYATGQAEAGTFTVTVNHPDYKEATAEAILVNGEVTILDVQLEKLSTVQISGRVIDFDSGEPVPDATVYFYNSNRNITTQTNSNGLYSLDLFEEDFDLAAAAWGYKLTNIEDIDLTILNGSDIFVYRGYEDGFFLDLGWTADNNGSSGFWVREDPIGTEYQGQAANPGDDIDSDFGDLCYLTGNGGGQAGNDDVDGGINTLTSAPMDLSFMENPAVNFFAWFFNAGGGGNPPPPLDDALTVRINGQDVLVIDESNPNWTEYSLLVKSYVDDLSNVVFEVETSDLENGHLVEAAIDGFAVVESTVSSTSDLATVNFSVEPNPFTQQFTIQNTAEYNKLIVRDITGKLIMEEVINASKTTIKTENWKSGMYILQVIGSNNKMDSQKIIKH